MEPTAPQNLGPEPYKRTAYAKGPLLLAGLLGVAGVGAWAAALGRINGFPSAAPSLTPFVVGWGTPLLVLQNLGQLGLVRQLELKVGSPSSLFVLACAFFLAAAVALGFGVRRTPERAG